jgi:peptidoglycan hydrolase-like protein with peptidoglycan-binding domain
MRRITAGLIGLLAVATLATLVAGAPAGASTAPRSHIHTATLRWPVVARGARGERVVTIQYLLQQRGFHSVRADGIYGPITAAAVRGFQRSRHLRVTGVVSAPTWNRLILTVRRGSRGSAVRAVQHSMRFAYGFRFSRVTGFFGLPTQRIVMAFQRGSRLTVDGIVGFNTWQTIVVFEP